ncbi:MAG: Na+/H+ antiporter subunit E [Lachnospiraceae bacterium]|nr:Na+/H+ antiporter subunit E [Lachnospiraceae bacterium]
MYIVLFLMWIIFNGNITPEIVLFGLVIAALMYAFLCKFMNYSIQKDLFLCKKSLRILQYVLVLIWEIIKANAAVMHMILSPHFHNEPVLIKFKTDLKSSMTRAVLANSITLTPGTITVSLEGDEYTVHCLDKRLAEGMESSVFVRLLHKLEEGGPS